MADNWAGSGYDVEPSADTGLLFYLKDKDQEARLRLCTPAFRYFDTITDKETGQEKEIRKIAWGAILKEMVHGQPLKRAVIFQASPQVYGFIKDLHDDPDWGDPSTYDIKVARPETKPMFYSVTPVPNKTEGQATINPDERAMLAEAKCNTVELIEAFIDKLKGGDNRPVNPASPVHTGPSGNPEYRESNNGDDPRGDSDPFADC